MKRWIGLAIVLAVAGAAHATLGAVIDGSGGESVGVALGPGTPPTQILLVAAFLGARLMLFFGAPFGLALAAAWPQATSRPSSRAEA